MTKERAEAQWLSRTTAVRYGIGVASVALALMVAAGLQSLLLAVSTGPGSDNRLALMLASGLQSLLLSRTILAVFIVAVTVSALYGGVGPAVFATVLSVVINSLVLLKPIPSSAYPEEEIVLGLFVVSSLLIILIAARRTRAEAALRQSEERYRLVVEGSGDYAMFLLDPRGRITSWNAGAEGLLGYREAEVLGQHLSLFRTPEDIAAGGSDEELALANRTGQATSEGWRVRKDGSRFHAHGFVRAVRDGTRVQAYVKIMHDVTARYHAEQRLTVQYRVSQVLAGSVTIQQGITAVVEAICGALGWDYGTVWEINQNNQALRCVDLWHPHDLSFPQFTAACRELSLACGVGLPGRAWLSGEPVRVTDIASQDSDFPRAAAAAAEDLHAAVAVPLRLGDETLGVLEFLRCKVQEPDHAVLPLLTAVANQLGQFIERKRAEAALQESGARTRAIVDAAVDGIITIDEHGRIDSANPATERLFGYPRDEMIGRNVSLLMPSPYRDEHDQYIANYLRTGERKVLGIGREVVGRRKNGTTFPIDLSLSEVVLDNRRVFTGIVRDISQRKHAEEQLTEALQRERLARKEAEEANRTKDEFLAVVSHELRTPLTPILTWSRLLRSGKLDHAATERALEAIDRATHSQAQLIEDLLDVSRITSGKLRLDVRPIELPPVVEAAVESVRPGAEAKGIRLEIVLDRNGGVVSGDPDRLQQVVWNLLSNAVKFTPRGGRIQVRLQRVDSHVEIAVSDTGQGINPQFLPHVFERFRQADSSSTRAHGGLGLGLAIVRHLVELHGGRVRAESPGEGKGATFVVELPLAILHQPLTPDRIHPGAGQGVLFVGKPTLGGVRILLVDDEPDTVETLRVVLEQAGAEIRTATSAVAALATLEAWHADVLVCDIGMPEEDGYALIHKVRALAPERGGYIPAVALTAYARVEDRLKVLSSGFQMHVPKPVEPAELVAIMATMKEWAGKSAVN